MQLVVDDPNLDARVRTADRAELGRAELLPVGGVPAHHFAAQLGLPVTVEDRDTEAFVEVARVRGRKRCGNTPHVAQRLEGRHVRIAREHHHRGGWQH